MILLTEPAARKVKELMSQEGRPDLALRVAVRPGGCSGFTYEMYFDSDIGEDDEVVEVHGVKVAVDKISSKFLDGASLDYREGLMDAGFTLDNPNAQRTCGCGQSFS
ncbi:MAG: iron-sulfur cluster insertion protein ErpA [Acidimicrobiia bacterium]